MNEGLDPKSKLELANLLLQIGFREEAIAELLAAASILRELGETEEAISVYKRVLDLEPENSTALRGMEEVAPGTPTRRVDEIVSRLDEETPPPEAGQPAETIPAPAPPKKKSAQITAEDKNRSWNDFKAALKEAEDQPDKRLALGERLLESGMLAEAQTQLEFSYRIQKTPRVIEYLARCYLKKGSYPRAVNLIKEGLKLPFPETAKLNLHYLLGTIYRSIDDTPRALDEFIQIAQLVPDYRDVQELIALLGGVIPKEGEITPAPAKVTEVKPMGPAPAEMVPSESASSKMTPPTEMAIPLAAPVPKDEIAVQKSPIEQAGITRQKTAPSAPEAEVIAPRPAIWPPVEERGAAPVETAAQPPGHPPRPIPAAAPSSEPTSPAEKAPPLETTPPLKTMPSLETAPIEAVPLPEPVPPSEMVGVVTPPVETAPPAPEPSQPTPAPQFTAPLPEVVTPPIEAVPPVSEPPQPASPPKETMPVEEAPAPEPEPVFPKPENEKPEPPPVIEERYPVIEEPMPPELEEEKKPKDLPPIGDENITFL